MYRHFGVLVVETAYSRPF